MSALETNPATQEVFDGTIFEILKMVVPAALGVSGGLLGAWLTTRSKLKEITTTFELERRGKDDEAKAKLKIQYLDPLRVSAESLRNRLVEIVDRRNRSDTLLHDTLQQLKANKARTLPADVPYELWNSDIDRIKWANDIGHFALSTLRLTALYLHHASKILEELPYVELNVGDDAALRGHLTSVSRALGGPYGIWEELQSSLGNYIVNENGHVLDYREFCKLIFHETQYLWFLRLIDFYDEMYLKTDAEIREMIKSLDALDVFLKQTSLIRAR